MPDDRIRPHHRPRRGFDHGRPIAQPSYVPTAMLLACLVVALLPFLRAPTHAVVIDLPVINSFSATPEAWPPGLVVHRIGVTPANEILWNGEPVTLPQLLDRLDAVKNESPRPGIVFWPEPLASYDLSVKLLNVLATAGVTQERFCLGGLSTHSGFGKRFDPVPVVRAAPPEAAPVCGPPSIVVVPLILR